MFVIEIGPVVAPAGTLTLIEVAETMLAPLAATPLNLTDDVSLKPTPVIVTVAPADARLGDSLTTEKLGVNLEGLTADLTGVVTVIVAAAAPLGTVAVNSVEETAVKAAVAEPKRTELAARRALPVMVTVAPVMALAGVKPVILGSFEEIVAVTAEPAAVPLPLALAALTTTRTVCPTIEEPSRSVWLEAPVIAVQRAPEALQSAHW